MANQSLGSGQHAATTVSGNKSGEQNHDQTSLVEYFGADSSFCGYCKRSPKESGSGKRSHNLNTFRLTATDYQDMIDTNWRRSGNFCYNPINHSSCCPNYPIICKTIEFILSRSQRKCIKAMNLYLLTGDTRPSMRLDYSAAAKEQPKLNVPIKSYDELKRSSKAKSRRFIKACERRATQLNIDSDEAMRQVRKKWAKCKQPDLTLEDYLYPSSDVFQNGQLVQMKHKLSIEMHHVDSKRSQELRETEHSVMVRYQRKVHNETSREWDMSRYCDFLVKSPLMTERLTNFNYLSQVPETSDHFDRFAVDVEQHAPNKYPLVKPPALPTAYGTYHCCYHLDEKLIAVGVLDVLPKCITTVYFFYDPDYAFLNMGIYSALIEISMVRQMNRHIIDKTVSNPLTDYYLGFYVHECRKMRYKTTFKPSYLLCSKTHKYVPTEQGLVKLRDTKYADFAEDDSNVLDRDFDVKKLLQIQIEPPVDLLSSDIRQYLASIEISFGAQFAELLLNGWLIPYASIIGDKLLPRLRLRLHGIHQHLVKRHERLFGRLRQRPAGQPPTEQSG